ncbi:MAG: ribonuclease Z [Chlorobi bacterium]|nr:ribonuclease Z [Chlorobiota bacterium]
MELRILGCHSATPKPDEYPTSQALAVKNRWLIIDSGEGMQMQLRRYGVKFGRIKHIFISHLHGDHVYGLFGFLSTLRLLNRQTEMYLFGPPELKPLLDTVFKHTQVELTFPLHFRPVEGDGFRRISDEKDFEVYAFPLKHRIETHGFLVKEKPAPRKLNMDAIRLYPEIGIWAYHNLKAGKDFVTEDGRVIPNEELTLPPPRPRSYAYCSDTAYDPSIVPYIRGADVLYHEATFAEADRDLAALTLHSTARQAAEIAREAGVGKLIIGHFSSRYKDPQLLLREAQEVFPDTELAYEGKQVIF